VLVDLAKRGGDVDRNAQEQRGDSRVRGNTRMADAATPDSKLSR
jgi:hypothetical protein